MLNVVVVRFPSAWPFGVGSFADLRKAPSGSRMIHSASRPRAGRLDD